MVIDAQHSECTKNHQNVHLEIINFMLYELCLHLKIAQNCNKKLFTCNIDNILIFKMTIFQSKEKRRVTLFYLFTKVMSGLNFPGDAVIKNPPANAETQEPRVQSLGGKDSLE